MSGIDLLKDQRRWAILTITFLALGIGWTFFSRLPASAANSNRQTASPRQGFAAPDFTLDLLGGGEVTLSDLRGAPVMLNLWASWCPPCRAEMPAIQAVYQEYGEEGLVVLAVNATNQDSESAAAAFVRDHGLTFPVPLDRDGSVMPEKTRLVFVGQPLTPAQPAETGAGVIPTVLALPVEFSVGGDPSEKGQEG